MSHQQSAQSNSSNNQTAHVYGGMPITRYNSIVLFLKSDPKNRIYPDFKLDIPGSLESELAILSSEQRKAKEVEIKAKIKSKK